MSTIYKSLYNFKVIILVMLDKSKTKVIFKYVYNI